MIQTTPVTIESVADFLARYREPAVYVPVQPPPWAEAGYCRINCEAAVARFGGEVVAGRVVWHGPNLTEAEWHCVWRNPDGHMIDVTPKPDGERRILFVVTHELVAANGIPPDNDRLPRSPTGERLCRQAVRANPHRRADRMWSLAGWEATRERVFRRALALNPREKAERRKARRRDR